MTDNACLSCLISGKVQGVWFRDSAKNKALQLEITGWVRNLQDGRVEVLACGKKDALDNFYSWLKKGPDLARVDDISCENRAWEEYDGFNIKPTA